MLSNIYSLLLPEQLTPEEFKAIMKDFDEPGSLAPTGLHLGGVKYMVIQGEPGAGIRGKKVIFRFYINRMHFKNLFIVLSGGYSKLIPFINKQFARSSIEVTISPFSFTYFLPLNKCVIFRTLMVSLSRKPTWLCSLAYMMSP